MFKKEQLQLRANSLAASLETFYTSYKEAQAQPAKSPVLLPVALGALQSAAFWQKALDQ